MNLVGVHALVWTGGWGPAEARYAIASTAQAGFDLIEIPVLDPASIDPGMTRGLLAEHGLRAACSLGLGFDTDVSSENLDTVRRGQDLLASAVTLTASLGADYLGGVFYSALGKYGAPATAAGRRNAVESLRRLAAQAAALDVTLGLEIVNRYESNLINTAEQALTLIDEIGADNIVVHLDTYHMNIEEASFAAPVALCGERLGYVHVGESNRGYLGTGTVNFAEFFTALRTAGYTGTITFESFSPAVVHPTLSNTLAVWRSLWQDGADLASHARKFIADGLGMR
jgi:D-psicose/D-tagatose/L-ribulose 3-epimerase